MSNESKATVEPNYHQKDRLFRKIYSDKAELLTLYNAMNKSHYMNSDELEINTLDNERVVVYQIVLLPLHLV